MLAQPPAMLLEGRAEPLDLAARTIDEDFQIGGHQGAKPTCDSKHPLLRVLRGAVREVSVSCQPSYLNGSPAERAESSFELRQLKVGDEDKRLWKTESNRVIR